MPKNRHIAKSFDSCQTAFLVGVSFGKTLKLLNLILGKVWTLLNHEVVAVICMKQW